MNVIVDTTSNNPVVSFENTFITFIETFITNGSFIYKSQLSKAVLTQKYCLTIQIPHITSFSQALYDFLLSSPSNALDTFEKSLFDKYNNNFTIHFISNQAYTPLRNITTASVNKLIKIRGIVISAGIPFIKPKSLFLICKKCLQHREATSFMPRSCTSSCGLDPFYVDCEKSSVIDEQYIKVQEMFEDIPVGEMPRHFSCVLEKNLVDSIQPGEKVRVTGIVQISNKTSHSNVFVKVIGIEKEKKNKGFFFTDEEKNKFYEFSKTDVKTNLLSFFAPQIHGNENIKLALLAMLFGGTRRSHYGVTLRGDINVLLLGDPGTAKSQLLKFTNIVSHGVYTSGKGSSAAGLTASVIKNRRGDFYLEGGALVLSDNGICCIDEFDKMDHNDRVSIHEAMEQQTISINKAGINTVLNTRCGILAAANPIYGRYDEYKSIGDNIDFNSTIMSRFDCIFVIRDVDNREKDIKLAMHILEINKGEDAVENFDDSQTEEKYKEKNENFAKLGLNEHFPDSLDFLRKYIAFAKYECHPTITEESKKKLNTFYVETRKKVKDMVTTKKIPITVRQLESLIRLSEALARMELSDVVTVGHVNEAINLFTCSTIDAVNKGHFIEGMTGSLKEVLEAGEQIKKFLMIGVSVKFERLRNEISADANIFGKAIEYLEKRGKVKLTNNGNNIIRII